jgi:hypothetical protein
MIWGATRLLLAALKLSRETKALNEVSRGYRVQSDVRRKTQLHKNIYAYLETLKFHI